MANLLGMIEQSLSRLKPRRNPYAQNKPYADSPYKVETTRFPGNVPTNPYSGEEMKPVRTDRQFGLASEDPPNGTNTSTRPRIVQATPIPASQPSGPLDPVVKTLRDLMAKKRTLETDPIEDDDSKLVNAYKGAKHAFRNAAATGDFEFAIGSLAGGALRGLFKSKEDEVRERQEQLKGVDADIEKVYKEQERQRKIRKEEAEIKKAENDSLPKPVKWDKFDNTRIWNPETKEIVEVGEGKTDVEWKELDPGRIWNPKTREIIEVGLGPQDQVKVEDANIDAETKRQKTILENKKERAKVRGSIAGAAKQIKLLKAGNGVKHAELQRLIAIDDTSRTEGEDRRIEVLNREIEENDKAWRAQEAEIPKLQKELQGITDPPPATERTVPKPKSYSKAKDPLGIL